MACCMASGKNRLFNRFPARLVSLIYVINSSLIAAKKSSTSFLFDCSRFFVPTWVLSGPRTVSLAALAGCSKASSALLPTAFHHQLHRRKKRCVQQKNGRKTALNRRQRPHTTSSTG